MADKQIPGILTIGVFLSFMVLGLIIVLGLKFIFGIELPVFISIYSDILSVVLLLVFVFLIYGFTKRLSASFITALVVFAVFFLFELYNFIKVSFVQFESVFAILWFLFGMIFYGSIWKYLYCRKEYFYTKYFNLDNSERKKELAYVIIFIVAFILKFLVFPSLQ